mmetsp:Transcript_7686/g.8767  ORF Transcript_7686/g.8767 Transcript_7686/m.8767 type:complete len:299 (+) Transcript_7686:23-919(+)|eukprot:CAMPEP_0205805994 /NCGR_PEP_ID=MMETSP0205-20121125/9360_1 /ASSEMBLY_ACC=CAM_ASM_000278 /TAXON_ID=36767 /ORGANISM="Euplotes focardii, Strain TN1" /LENGTH=298 /DNA_ID=CAMNT_0053078053 /DNA_START=23 /DNA_END=919 /DNA_ORIENTATION=-
MEASSLIDITSNFITAEALSDALITTETSSCSSTYAVKDSLPKSVKVFDCSASKGAADKYKEERIPGALFLDLNQKFVDPEGKYPTTYPTEAVVRTRLGQLGVKKDDEVICYVQDSATRFSARALFILKSFGFVKVAILRGGLEAWRTKGYPIETTEPKEETKGEFEGDLTDANEHLAKYDDVKAIEEETEENMVIDTRSKEEHEGKTKPAFADAKAGKIPNSINIPSTSLLQEDGSFKSADELKEIFDKSGIDKNKKLVCHCNNGNQASIVAVALQESGYKNVKLYDGSWSEYGSKI